MMSDELDLLRKLHFGSVSEDELMDIFHRYRDNYRVLMHLAMHPKFPDNFALNIISRLNAVDLIRVIKNNRTNPFTRKKAELEFQQKYNKFPLGEKLAYMKIAPYSLMVHLIEENDKRVVAAMLNGPYCTEDLVVRFINRQTPRSSVYEALVETEWYKRPSIAEAIAHDTEAPIRMLIMTLPFLNRHSLRKLYENEATHEIVKKRIIDVETLRATSLPNV
ncbi:MAG: hypothetical protein NT166_23800 [Candidatus Aminicenantes bacterium]|nr:hypothetical protein [Candidatus Aminicenantes bacterium]